MARRYHAVLLAVVILAWGSGTAVASPLRGRVVYVGFQGSGADQYEQGTYHYRAGVWTPVLVELANDGRDRFEGVIEIRQPDRDRDEVLARREVVVQGTRRYFLYVPGGIEQRTEHFRVRVYTSTGQFAELRDDQGRPVRELIPPGQVTDTPPGYRVILDISTAPVALLKELLRDPQIQQDLVVARSSPGDLPDAAAGLDLADVIVWDAADPSILDLAQRNALLEWTRQGGTLILTVSRNWELVNREGFREILPAVLRGAETMTQPPVWLSEWLGIGVFDGPGGRLDPAVTYCPVRRADLLAGATVLVPASRDIDGASDESGSDLLLVVRRPCGRGEVVLVAAELRDLLQVSRRKVAMLGDLLGVRRQTVDPDSGMGWRSEVNLFGIISQMIAFGVTAWLYLFVAIAFVVMYLLAATAGSWAWLRRRRIERHSWVAFAGVALAASLVSIAAVRWFRGIGYRVQEVAVVDGWAGTGEATAVSFLGLKAPAHIRVDLRVPQDASAPDRQTEASCSIRALPPLGGRAEGFAATDRYEAAATVGQLRSLPLRATLKQFEAHWQGELQGQLSGALHRVREGSIELRPDSWLRNDLGTDLSNCYLVVAAQDPLPGGGYRELGMEAYRIGNLRDGQQVTWQALLTQHELAAAAATAGSASARPLRQPLATLLEEDWLGRLISRARLDGTGRERPRPDPDTLDFQRALLVLTIQNEINPRRLVGQQYEVIRQYGHRLDRSAQVMRDTALFVGFSQTPGPVRLCYRRSDRPQDPWRPIPPTEPEIMYRIAVPIQ